MTDQQPEALRLADWLEDDACDLIQPLQAAAELRRLHEEAHTLFDIGHNIQTELFAAKARIAALEQALGMAVDQLEECEGLLIQFEAPHDSCVGATAIRCGKLVATARQTLGGAA